MAPRHQDDRAGRGVQGSTRCGFSRRVGLRAAAAATTCGLVTKSREVYHEPRICRKRDLLET